MSRTTKYPAPTRAANALITDFADLWKALVDPPARVALETEFITQYPTNPVLGAAHERGAEQWIETTFIWQLPPGEEAPRDVMIHLNSITDAHREDIRPALLRRIATSSLWSITYLLPDTLIASYRIVVAQSDPLPRNSGADRASWLRIHALGKPDPRGQGTLPNPLGSESSVLVMPNAWQHPAWGETAERNFPQRQTSTLTTIDVPTFDGELRRLHIYRPNAATPPARLLLLFDGEVWIELGVQAALDRWKGDPIAAVLVSSVSPQRRSADLPHPERIAEILRDEVLPAAAATLGHNYSAEEIIVAGQSYGGLASAALLAEYPELVGNAIAQSPSFQFRAGETGWPSDGQRGDVSMRLPTTASAGQLIMMAGSNEGWLTEQARTARDALTSTAVRLSYREFSGGHDYAWWRHGLFWGLDALEASLLEEHPEES